MRVPEERRFPLFWVGRAASQFGDQITLLALPWLMADVGGSPLANGALEAVAFAPMLLFGLLIGAYADRHSRRTAMMRSDLVRAAVLCTIPVVALLHEPGVAHVLVVAFIVGTGSALFEAAAQPFLTDIVPPEQIVRSNARLSLTEGLAEVSGPAIAGVLIGVLGAAGAIAFDAATFVLSVLALAALGRVPERLSSSTGGYRASISEGARALWSDARLRALTLLQAGGNIGSGMVLGLFVFFLQREIELDGWQAGLIFAGNGVGGVFSGLVTPRIVAKLGVGRTVVRGLFIAACGYVLIATTTQESWALGAGGGYALVGVGVVMMIIASASLRQRVAAPELLGRITTSYRMVVNGAVAIGALAGGVVATVAGIRTVLVIGAALYLIVSAVGFLSPLGREDAFGPTAG